MLVINETRRRLLRGATAAVLGLPRAPSLARFLARANEELDHPSANADAALYARLASGLGRMPRRPAPTFTVLETVKLDRGVRQKIRFMAEGPDARLRTPVDMINAYLFVPDHPVGARLPAIIAIHQDGSQSHIGKSEPAGLAGDRNLFYGLELFERDFVVICPDRFAHAERRRVLPNDISPIDPERDLGLLNTGLANSCFKDAPHSVRRATISWS